MKKETIIALVLDETGSMANKREETIAGVNEYFDTIQEKNTKVLITLVKFSSEKYEVMCSNMPVKKAPRLSNKNYIPNGGTPLFDSVGKTIRTIEAECAGKGTSPAVLCVIVTDGEENASVEYTRERIFEVIKEREDAGWNFAYLGANQDVWTTGVGIGVRGTSTMNFADSGGGMVLGLANVAAASNAYLDNDSTLSCGAGYFQKSSDWYTDTDVKLYQSRIEDRIKKSKDK